MQHSTVPWRTQPRSRIAVPYQSFPVSCSSSSQHERRRLYCDQSVCGVSPLATRFVVMPCLVQLYITCCSLACLCPRWRRQEERAASVAIMTPYILGEAVRQRSRYGAEAACIMSHHGGFHADTGYMYDYHTNCSR